MVSVARPFRRRVEMLRFSKGSQKSPIFLIRVQDIGLRYPHRGVLRWLRLNPTDGKIFFIHPNSTTIQKLARDLWLDAESVRAPVRGCEMLKGRKVVVPRIQFNLSVVGWVLSLPFCFD
jgi:hypothetical protein